ncbi:helix-turn-helix domain-containing protein [Limosilactobacillus mucosae]|uniref:helix-turn-helix domain-containing protein n=1 Tax=Limosilactobacillus mucosae TaxID=97478 RepID=UPI0022DFF1F0|nr:helix-turn-helix domain-containing protein [Limosilactobacillus mucosae]
MADSKGFLIPAKYWSDADLSLSEKVMITEIERLASEDGCLESNNYFARFIGLSKSRVSEIITKLSLKGYLETQYFTDQDGQNRRRIYIVSKREQL